MNEMGQPPVERADAYLRSDVWPVGTRVRLLSVPWDSAYRNVIAWESAEARDRWFESQTDDIWFSTQFNYLRPGEPVAVSVPYSSAYRYNYIAVTNPQQPVDDEGPERTYYYFVTGLTYLSPQASLMEVQLDVMTTYAGEITVGKSFVDRGHIAMANDMVNHNPSQVVARQLNDYLTMPEGIDVGSEYYPIHKEYVDLMGSDDNGSYCVVISTADLQGDPGSVSAPNLDVAGGTWFDGLPSGCDVYCFPVVNISEFMHELQDKSWVAQCILSLYVLPSALVDTSRLEQVRLFGGSFVMYKGLTSFNAGMGNGRFDSVGTVSDVFSKLTVEEGEPEKLLCYPYSVIEMSTFDGNPVFLKPQNINGNSITLAAIGCSLMPFARFAVFPWMYMVTGMKGSSVGLDYTVIDMLGNERPVSIDSGAFLDCAVWLQDFPQFAIVNNNYLTYLASNRNRLAYQYQSAGWALDRSNAQANNAYEVAQANTDLGYALSYNNVRAGVQNANLGWASGVVGALGGGLSGVAGSMASGIAGSASNSAGGVIGGYAGLATTGIGLASSLAQNELSMQQATNSLQAAASNAGLTQAAQTGINNRNRSLADFVNNGDYQNRIAGIEATVQDAALTPPSTVGQSGGEGFTWKNALVGIQITFKTIGGAARRAVSDYFRRYGYSIHRWLDCGSVWRMLCMTRFAYWRLLETNVTCARANETEREAIRGVFEKGVTLWDAPESIGTIDLDGNQPKSGYSY